MSPWPQKTSVSGCFSRSRACHSGYEIGHVKLHRGSSRSHLERERQETSWTMREWRRLRLPDEDKTAEHLRRCGISAGWRDL
jgi:hypothetical protein